MLLSFLFSLLGPSNAPHRSIDRIFLILTVRALITRYMLWPCICRLSARPSVTRRHCIKAAECRITQTAQHDSP